jgi:thiamine biosynthesis lipoprotein
MKRLRRAFALAGALTSLLASRGLAADRPPTLARYEGSRISMACVYSVIAYGPDAASLPSIVDAALDEVDRIDRLMSHYKPDSPLSRLNRTAAQGQVPVEPELFDFLVECLRYSRDSDGAFDVTVGPLMKAWGFFGGEGRVPEDLEISDLRSRIGYSHVVADADRKAIRFDRPGVELDLGGIAKGYAVDRVVALLKERGVVAALVSAGGSTLYGLGAPPGRRGWGVSIQDPVDPRRIGSTVRLKDRALSVSGSAEKSVLVSGRSYSHIMDPRTGRPAEGVLSVAVLASSGTAGDALDDAFFVQGLEGTRAYLKRLPATEALFFLPASRGRWRLVRVRG